MRKHTGVAPNMFLLVLWQGDNFKIQRSLFAATICHPERRPFQQHVSSKYKESVGFQRKKKSTF